MKQCNRRRRPAVVALLALVVAASADAFTASNTVPSSRAGTDSGTISGYTVSNIHYALASRNADISAVSFDLDAAATTVKASLDGGTTYSSCTNSNGNALSCTVPEGITVLGASAADVVTLA